MPWLTLVRAEREDGEAAWWRAPPRQQVAARGVTAALAAARAQGAARIGARVHIANPAAHAVGLVFDSAEQKSAASDEEVVDAGVAASIFGEARARRAKFDVAPAPHAPRAFVLAPFDADAVGPGDDSVVGDGGATATAAAFPWPASMLAAWRASAHQEPQVLQQSSTLVPCDVTVPSAPVAAGRMRVTAYVHPDTLRDLGSSAVGVEAVPVPLNTTFFVGDNGDF